jgi:DivIVA domain-containing protein
MLTPADIQRKRFTVVHLRAGYDQGEVDDFIDSLINDYEVLWRRLENAEARADRTQVLPTASTQPSDMIAKVLAVAEETAEKHIHEGKVTAEEIRLKAQDEAKAITSEAEADKNRIVGEKETERARLQARIDELTRTEGEIVSRLRTALEGWE